MLRATRQRGVAKRCAVTGWHSASEARSYAQTTINVADASAVRERVSTKPQMPQDMRAMPARTQRAPARSCMLEYKAFAAARARLFCAQVTCARIPATQPRKMRV